MRSRAELLLLLLLAGCGVAGRDQSAGTRVSTRTPVAEPIKVGDPYMVRGIAYRPADVREYDEVGWASWYGEEVKGNRTSNGERFNPDGISAAHTTLPMPSYVEVTALDTGRTILVRINDRGPFSRRKLIDLSRGAARQLGIEGHGNAAVRVRRVEASADEQRTLTRGSKVGERPRVAPEQLAMLRRRLAARPDRALAPVGEGVPAVIRPGFQRAFVQVGTFANRGNAERLAASLGGLASAAGSYWRVRLGPYDPTAARRSLADVVAKGYRDATIVGEAIN